MQLRVNSNIDEVERWLTSVERKRIPSMLSQVVNETTRGVRTDLSSAISNNTGLKKSATSQRDKSLYISRKATRSNPEAVIEASRKTSDFDRFKNKPRYLKRQNATRVTVKGKRNLIRKAIVIDGKVKARGRHQGGRFKFDGRRRFKTLRGLSVGSQFEQPYIKSGVDRMLEGRFNKAFQRAAKRL